MIVEKFEQIAQENGFEFDYGPSHWLNLNDYEDDTSSPWEERKKILLLHWTNEKYLLSEYSAIEERQYSGEFTFCVRSKLYDGSYMFKYVEYIKRLKEMIGLIFESFSDCDGWQIDSWQMTEVTNTYDTNLDGIKVSFTTTK